MPGILPPGLRRPVLSLLAAAVLLLPACASTTLQDPGRLLEDPGYRAAVSHAPDQNGTARSRTRESDSLSLLRIPDPLIGFNRAMYTFNAKFDAYVFLPVVRTYETALPLPLRTGVSRVFSHLNEVPTLANCLLQGDLAKAGVTLGRLAMNTVLGLGGLVDVASGAGLYPQDEDFGQTLGVWGVPSGPYVVLPLFGPSSLRDAAGLTADSAASYVVTDAVYDAAGLEDAKAVHYSVTGLRAVDKRAGIPLHYYEAGTPFEYEWVRFLYLEKRALDVER